MTDKRDYYELLGVSKDAVATDIRKAYKKLALKHHPDRNRGSEDATARFKEVTEAYQVLSDDSKRARYDQFGHAGVEGSADFGGDIFSHFQDLFSDFFGSSQRRRGPQRGRDLRVEQTLTLEEAVLGCKKEIDLTSPVQCRACDGSGAQQGTSTTACHTCGGHGQVQTARGFVMFTQTCPSCQGEGRVIETPCGTCDGVGWEEKKRTVTVSFPAGIDAGHRLRVTGQGLPGPHGGPAGSLYVDVQLAPHQHFEREGVDLIIRQTVSFPEAALGTKLDIEMLDGSIYTVKVSHGTQPGTIITARGKGAPSVNGHGVGSLHVVLQVEVPKRLSRRAKKLLRELENELDGARNAAE